jgi:hypothetical protein
MLWFNDEISEALDYVEEIKLMGLDKENDQ